MRVTALSIVMALLLCASISHARIQDNLLTIHGCVKNELQITPAALKKFDQTDVQLNDIQKDGQFKGIYNFRGVPLKTLLQLAGIEKKESDFNKPVDLVIVVKNPSGDQAVLSWGEIFFKNPSHVLIGLSANPIQPHKGADHFKDKKAYTTMMETLNRTIAFPRLIISQERFSDRCLESISDIEVIDLKPKVTGEKSPSVFSDSFNLLEKRGGTCPHK